MCILGAKSAMGDVQSWKVFADYKRFAHLTARSVSTPVKVIGPAADNVLPSVVAASSVASPQGQLTCEDGLYCFMQTEKSHSYGSWTAKELESG